MKIEVIGIDKLVFADYNPRNITEKQVQDLKESIEKFGIVEPIVVNSNPERLNVIVGGHQRARIMKMLGATEVPVHYVNLTLEKEKELNIRLNKNVGEWDYDKLANEFNIEDLLSYGFSHQELGVSANAKDEIDTDNLGASMDSYLDGNIRQIVLYFKKEEYDEVIPRMEKVMEEMGVPNHTEAYLKMLKHYEDTGAQK